MKKKKLMKQIFRLHSMLMNHQGRFSIVNTRCDLMSKRVAELEDKVRDLEDPMLNVGANGELLPVGPVKVPEARYDKLDGSRLEDGRPRLTKKEARRVLKEGEDMARVAANPEKAYKEFAEKAVKDAAN